MHRTEDYKRENTEHGIIHSPPPRERVASPQLVQSRLVEQLDVVALRRTLRSEREIQREGGRGRARARANARRRERDAYIRPVDFRRSRGWLALLVARNDATSREKEVGDRGSERFFSLLSSRRESRLRTAESKGAAFVSRKAES